MEAGPGVGGGKMNIVYAMTRNVYNWSIPSMKSLAEHNPKARVFVLCEDDEFPLETPIKVETINVSNQGFFGRYCVNINNYFGGYINLLKVVYPEILKVDKVIHLDIDTIICESLEPMWKTDVKGKWFAAVPEYYGSYKPFGTTYYNAGVMLLNLKQMRADKICPVMAEYLNTVRQPYADQDAWNKFGQDKAVVLDTRYNESAVTGRSNDPAIVHYCGITNWWMNRYMDRHEYLFKYV